MKFTGSSILLAAILFLAAGDQLYARRGEFDFSTALPDRKRPIDVVIRRNPFQVAAEPERPLPVVRDREDPALKLPSLVSGRIRSVIRQPRPLILLDDCVVQPGDEIRLNGVPLLPKHRTVLKSIEEDRVIFHLTSIDPQQPGEVDVPVELAPAMRKSE